MPHAELLCELWLTGQLLILGVSAACLLKFLFLLVLVNKTLNQFFGHK